MSPADREALVRLVALWNSRADEEVDRDSLCSEEVAEALRVCAEELYATMNSLPVTRQ